MKKIITISALLLLFVPVAVFGQGVQTESIDVNLDELNNASSELSDATGLLQQIIDIGSRLYEVAKNLIGAIDNFLQNNVGISFSELITSLFTAIVNILEVVLDLLQKIIPNT